MAGYDLIFTRPAAPVTGGPVDLVFGASSGVAPDTVELHGGGRITGMRGMAVLRFAVRAVGSGRITRLGGTARVHWDANVSRGTRIELQAAWQAAVPVASAMCVAWQAAAPLRVASNMVWQQGRTVAAVMRSHWQEALRLRAASRSHWQQGELRRSAVDVVWQETVRLRVASRGHWQQGELRRNALDVVWQETLRLRAASHGHWQNASPLRASVRTEYGDGQAVRSTLHTHWQEAMRPRSGRSDVAPPRRPPCYVPGVPVDLVFKSKSRSGLPLSLLFVCSGHGSVIPPAAVVVLPRRSYIVINSIEIRRADALAGDPLPSESFSMSLNHQSWTWTFSASFHASARDAVALGPGGQPVELEVRVNGQPFRLQAERIGRSKRFPEHLVTVSGRGKAAVLDALHAPVQTFSHALDRTAQQLMADVLTVNGVGFGWGVDWQLTDWLVPGGVWMHQGTCSSALADIAASVGGYLQPHDTDAVLRVLPRWPKPWWEWDTLAPDIELPAGIGEVEDTEVVDLPGYNRIFVSGEGRGILADLTRSGTPGDMLKPMAVHPLITTIEAARQRASSELSESGRALKHKLTMPVLPQTGVIKPGTVLRYVDDDAALRIGIVRATSISQQFPVLTQSLEIDSHV